jgi:hypothetical protein
MNRAVILSGLDKRILSRETDQEINQEKKLAIKGVKKVSSKHGGAAQRYL